MSPFAVGTVVQPEQKAAFIEAVLKNGTCTMRIEGQSMWPFIKSGDLVTIVSCKKMPVIGSVAAVFNHDQCIVHRVVKCRERPDTMGEVWICGDSSPGSQARIQPSEIVGTAVSLERNGTRHTRWLHPPLSHAAMVLGYVLRAIFSLRISSRK